MKTNLKKIIFLFLFIFLFQNLFIVSSTIDKKIIKDKLEEILQDDLKRDKANNFIFYMLKELFKNLFSLKKIVRAVIYITIVIAVILITYFIIRFIVTKNYYTKKNNTLKNSFKGQNFIFDKNTLNNLINMERYSESVLYLHRSTIFFLIKNEIVYKKNMTNYDFFVRIKNKDMAEGFRTIYRICEKILFDDYEADKDDYILTKNNYDRYFRT